MENFESIEAHDNEPSDIEPKTGISNNYYNQFHSFCSRLYFNTNLPEVPKYRDDCIRMGWTKNIRNDKNEDNIDELNKLVDEINEKIRSGNITSFEDVFDFGKRAYFLIYGEEPKTNDGGIIAREMRWDI